MALHQAGHVREAAAIYQQILRLEAEHPDALQLLGVAAYQLGAIDTAAVLVERAIARVPGNEAFHSNLSLILTAQKRLDEAEAHAREALRLKPGYLEALLNLGNALKELGRTEEAVLCFREICRVAPQRLHAWGNYLFALQYAGGRTTQELFDAHRQFAAVFEPDDGAGARRATFAASPDPARRLRIGYLSPDMREHPVAYYLQPVLEHHDRTRFEIVGYADQLLADPFTQQLAAHCDLWVPCRPLNDDALAQRIRDDRIDILVDLAGHTADNRLGVFAQKPAPVQVSWLGYVATTGLKAMDWRIGHVDTDPPGAEALYTESLHRFDGYLWWAYRPREGMPEPTAAPCLRNGFITFGSTNNIGKLNAEVIACWAQILLAVPGSRLLLAGIPQGSSAGHLLDSFERNGVARDRLTVMGKLSPPQFWALHAEIDLILDPFPYNGGATTCDALWLGVPVLALCGDTFVGRMGHAMLRHVGLPELSSSDTTDYVRRAVALSQRPEVLAQLRAGLRDRVARSGLRDEAGFTRALEDFYRGACSQWCQKAAPAQA